MSDWTDEEWRPVVGYEGVYEVSSLGRVRSVDRIASNGKHYRGKLLKLHTGRKYVTVVLSSEGELSTRMVHRLVAEAFGVGGEGPMVLHYNDDPHDNHVENLRYGTGSDNEADKIRNGGNPRASSDGCPRGHAFTGRNLDYENGARRCRACRSAAWAVRAGKTSLSISEMADIYYRALADGWRGNRGNNVPALIERYGASIKEEA